MTLAGRNVVVTRARTQASDLVLRLREAGAEPVEVAAIAITDSDDGGAGLRAAVDHLDTYEWLVVTSTNGAARVLQAVVEPAALANVRIAAVGPRTAAVFESAGVRVDLQPERAVAESLVEGFPVGVGSVLLAVAEVTRDVIERGLRERGWTVDRVAAYRTVGRRPSDEELAALAVADAITFTSSSTVTRLLDYVAPSELPPVVACIGPVTSATARDAGVNVTLEATEHTINGLITALTNHYADPS